MDDREFDFDDGRSTIMNKPSDILINECVAYMMIGATNYNYLHHHEGGCISTAAWECVSYWNAGAEFFATTG